jgi:DNA-binding XRE family transcriptional regulator
LGAQYSILTLLQPYCAYLGNSWQAVKALRSPLLIKLGLSVIGPQVRKWRDNRGWSQEQLACKLQLQRWSISRHSLAKLELGLRRVSDCELFFLARVLRLDLRDLFPKQMPLKEVGPAFQTGRRASIFPARGDN